MLRGADSLIIGLDVKIEIGRITGVLSRQYAFARLVYLEVRGGRFWGCMSWPATAAFGVRPYAHGEMQLATPPTTYVDKPNNNGTWEFMEVVNC